MKSRKGQVEKLPLLPFPDALWNTEGLPNNPISALPDGTAEGRVEPFGGQLAHPASPVGRPLPSTMSLQKGSEPRREPEVFG